MLNDIQRMAALLQSVAFGREPADAVSAGFARLLDAGMGCLVTARGVLDNVSPFAGFNFSDESFAEYVKSFADRDIQLQAMSAKYAKPPGVFIFDDIMPYRELVRTEMFNDLWRPLDAHHFAGLQYMGQERGGLTTMRLLLTRGKHGTPFGPRERHMLQALSPAFDASATIFMDRLTLAHATLAAAFEHAADAVAILDHEGRMRYSNATFTALRRELDPSCGMHWEMPLQRTIVFTKLQRAFIAALADVRDCGLAARRCEFVATHQGTVRRFVAILSSVMTNAGVRARPGDHLFMLVLRECAAVQDERLGAMRQRFDLSPAEMKVLRLFANGAEMPAIAAELKITVHTARAHIKALLAKTDCRRQAELMRLVATVSTARVRLDL